MKVKYLSKDSEMLEKAYQHCRCVTQQHYENFPVASWFLPASLRRPVTAIYAFARSADDIADEGNANADQRIQKLLQYTQILQNIDARQEIAVWETLSVDEQSIFIALSDTIVTRNLPVSLLQQLLQAFIQDVEKTRYASFAELMQYCRLSANPVGRLLLYLQDVDHPRYLAYSDAICSALQLLNFYQDIVQDYSENQRIYLPQDEMQDFSVTEEDIAQQRRNQGMQALMAKQVSRCHQLLQAGAPLAVELKGRFAFELRLLVIAASRLLYRLQENPEALFARPRLSWQDKVWVVFRAIYTSLLGKSKSR